MVRMMCCVRRFAFVVSLSLCLCPRLFAEDVKLREEAVRLMEQANEVSLPMGR